jgi:hypothetical protein
MRSRWDIGSGDSISSRRQGGSGDERGTQRKPSHERETTTIFSFRKSILNHLHEVVGRSRCEFRRRLRELFGFRGLEARHKVLLVAVLGTPSRDFRTSFTFTLECNSVRNNFSVECHHNVRQSNLTFARSGACSIFYNVQSLRRTIYPSGFRRDYQILFAQLHNQTDA